MEIPGLSNNTTENLKQKFQCYESKFIMFLHNIYEIQLYINFQVGHLTAIGSSSIENMGSRILKYAMSNKLAEIYNWIGSKNKSSFGRLMLPSLIKRKFILPQTIYVNIKQY